MIVCVNGRCRVGEDYGRHKDLATAGRVFGQVPLPKWQIVQAAWEHGIWTLGATVPCVRLQGGTPHSFSIVPAAN
ncbi:MAG TPA: hypothetical protein VFZ56_04315 [Gemmatimonadaceae bacterium]